MLLRLLVAVTIVCQLTAAINNVPEVYCALRSAEDCRSATTCDSCTGKGLQCLQCGCQSVCLPPEAEPQSPHMLCSDGSVALQCNEKHTLLACHAAACGSEQCSAYKCGDTCTALCQAADNVQQLTGTVASTRRSILEAAASAVKEGDIICPDRVTPAKTCVDIPPGDQNTCAVTDCRPNNSCKMVSCPCTDGKSTNCSPVCVATDFKPSGKCPAEFPEVQCTSTVCNLACKKGKRCVTNTCGNCTATCVDEVDEGPICLVGSPVNCVKDPCMGKTCPSNRVCVAEYCGGCNHACVLKKACASGKPRRPCLKTANRCMAVKCAGGSTCVPDQCNNCAGVCVPPCPPGQYVNKDNAACTDCPAGYYCVGGSKELATPRPKPCNAGKFADVAGLSECKTCEAGNTTPAKPKNKGYTKCRPAA